MKELLLKIFNKRKYWQNKMNELATEQREAKQKWMEARRLHAKSKKLYFQYALATDRIEKAYPLYLRAMGKV